MGSSPEADGVAAVAEVVAQLAREQGMAVATSESLTAGAVASALGAAPQASQWFRGAVVAYASQVKHGLLAVPPGPVVSEAAVVSMALTTGELLDADVVLAVSGAGGPDPQDGQPPGTVWFAVSSPSRVDTEELHFDGDPAEVVHQTVQHGLEVLERALRALSSSRPAAGRDDDLVGQWGGIVRASPDR